MFEICRTDLRHIIEKRIGTEHFTDKLSRLPKHESYSHAAKKPQLTYNQPSEVIFDFEFTRLFKRLESKSVVSVSTQSFRLKDVIKRVLIISSFLLHTAVVA